jgi:HEAT repeat protein
MPLVRKDPTNATPADPADSADLLSTGSPDERWSAARRLADTPDGVAALSRALARETDDRVREAIFTSLARHGDAESIDAVISYLRSDDANLRRGALDTLRAMMPAARPRLPALLADPDPDVRILVCDLPRGLPGVEATGLLCEVIARDRDPNVCAAAADVLAEVGVASALPVLAACAARFPDQPFLGFALTVAAQQIVAQVPDE